MTELSPFVRSKIGNGALFDVPVGGGRAARRWRDLHREFLAELGGDIERLSPAERYDVRHAASLQLCLEQMDESVARGESIDGTGYAHLTSELHRLLVRLGLAYDTKRMNGHGSRGRY